MLGTVRPDDAPHVVPVVFAVESGDQVVYTAVDDKPKSGRPLQRLANLEHNPAASLLVQHYDDDWAQLWWVRADGVAQIHHHGPACEAGLGALRAKYPQYRSVGLAAPVIAVRIVRWAQWQGG
ncbi:TIGR03668 family PPOX class F420-dependent oxidoreductase [Mycobacterium sp. SMC-4]|uniref:TIGR03668 family PPOX class F420-dependent oxidoreductase n=1 Tax=Mycobacterium sp. SMC-4 TaxID=2857059 RepID=UPI0021B26F39|nr:TIGR03668 family PPOX class F420-dependent oxidoreductase [Mycobacterium sp. SMC-4]